jgi:hypothetical protein
MQRWTENRTREVGNVEVTSTISSWAAGLLWKMVSSLGSILSSMISLKASMSSWGELKKLLSSFLEQKTKIR